MKTPRWFTRNRLSYLRIPAAVTLIAAAVVIGGIASAFNPDPERRLTNDDGTNGGYVSDYFLATGQPRTPVCGLGEFDQSRKADSDLRRRLGWNLREPRRRERGHDRRRQGIRRVCRRRQGLGGAEPTGEVPR